MRATAVRIEGTVAGMARSHRDRNSVSAFQALWERAMRATAAQGEGTAA